MEINCGLARRLEVDWFFARRCRDLLCVRFLLLLECLRLVSWLECLEFCYLVFEPPLMLLRLLFWPISFCFFDLYLDSFSLFFLSNACMTE